MYGDLDYALELAMGRTLPRQTELVKLLLLHGATVIQQRIGRSKNSLVWRWACGSGADQQLINHLVKAGADWTTADPGGLSVLHHAASYQRLDVFAHFMRKGASVHVDDRLGVSALHVAMSHDGFASFLLNCDCSMELTTSYPWGIAHDAEPAWISNKFRLYQKRFGNSMLQQIANLQPKDHVDWSPLCLMSAAGRITAMKNLIELGASLDHESSPHGSALMAACANRQLQSVKFLVRKGASLSYFSNTKGRHISCLSATRGSQEITAWVLVGRFTDQQRITQHPQDPNSLGNDGDCIVKAWSGITKAEFVITGTQERQVSESSKSYFARLQRGLRSMRGMQVPPTVAGRRTCRPSRLVPTEIVHVSPDDKRVPRDLQEGDCEAMERGGIRRKREERGPRSGHGGW